MSEPCGCVVLAATSGQQSELGHHPSREELGVGSATLRLPAFTIPPWRMHLSLMAARVRGGGAGVEYAELDPVLYASATPNDPDFNVTGRLWHLPQISAPAAWDSHTGSRAVRVCVVDSGVNFE